MCWLGVLAMWKRLLVFSYLTLVAYGYWLMFK